MLQILYILLAISMAAVVFTLVMGGKSMVTHNDGDRSTSNKWMWRRIWAQAVAVMFLLLILLVRKNGG